MTFGFANYGVTLIPLSTAMILFQTNPFWISVLACILLSERLKLVEVIGIFLCFGGVIMISLSKADKVEDQDLDEQEAAPGA